MIFVQNAKEQMGFIENGGAYEGSFSHAWL